MSFQILNKNKEPIVIDELDKEVCILWDKEYDSKHYATPMKRTEFPEGLKGEIKYLRQTNWFDSIGFAIHCNKITNWDEVFLYFYDLYKDIRMQYKYTLEQLMPDEIKLIDHWKCKGYTPKYVED